MTPALLKELAELIRYQHVRRVSGNKAIIKTNSPIDHEWLYRFLNWHPTVQGIYARQIYARQMQNGRFYGASCEVIER